MEGNGVRLRETRAVEVEEEIQIQWKKIQTTNMRIIEKQHGVATHTVN